MRNADWHSEIRARNRVRLQACDRDTPRDNGSWQECYERASERSECMESSPVW